MIATILGLVGGIGGLVTAAVTALVAGWAGVLVGRWREQAATEAKIKAAEMEIIAEINEAGHEGLAEAIRARRAAERDWVRRHPDQG